MLKFRRTQVYGNGTGYDSSDESKTTHPLAKGDFQSPSRSVHYHFLPTPKMPRQTYRRLALPPINPPKPQGIKRKYPG